VRTNYVLIDYENVQPDGLEALNRRNFRAKVFVGANQAKIPIDVVLLLQKMGEKAELIKMDGSGSNALDFHIAFYAGQITAVDHQAHVHIISKDTGFDPLVKHLKGKGITACREPDVKAILNGNGVGTNCTAERATRFAEDLRKRVKARPGSIKALKGTAKVFFKNELTDGELDSVIEKLIERGIVTVTGNAVSYKL
jgi:hypothetical protein